MRDQSRQDTLDPVLPYCDQATDWPPSRLRARTRSHASTAVRQSERSHFHLNNLIINLCRCYGRLLTICRARQHTVFRLNLLLFCSNNFCRSVPNRSMIMKRNFSFVWIWPEPMYVGTPNSFNRFCDLYEETAYGTDITASLLYVLHRDFQNMKTNSCLSCKFVDSNSIRRRVDHWRKVPAGLTFH